MFAVCGVSVESCTGGATGTSVVGGSPPQAERLAIGSISRNVRTDGREVSW